MRGSRRDRRHRFLKRLENADCLAVRVRGFELQADVLDDVAGGIEAVRHSEPMDRFAFRLRWSIAVALGLAFSIRPVLVGSERGAFISGFWPVHFALRTGNVE